jgi:putative Mn2+ efflux pump MntP
VTWLEIFLLACALAVDAFSVGAVVGLRHRQARQIFRLAFHFGLFQALFPLAGALASHLVLGAIEAWDHWVVFLVLSGLGARMVVNAIRGGEDPQEEIDLTKGMRLVGLSAAVSIDAAAAGLLIEATDTPLLASVAIIGLVAAVATAVAMLAASKLSARVGKRAEVGGGIVLILIGTRTLLAHLGWLGG